MNNTIRKTLQLILGFTLIGVIGYAIWLLAQAFYIGISSASPEVSAAIVGAMATVFVGTSAVLLSQAHERKRASEEAHRLRKVEIYEGFINMVSRMIGSANQQLSIKEPNQKELMQIYSSTSQIYYFGAHQR